MFFQQLLRVVLQVQEGLCPVVHFGFIIYFIGQLLHISAV
jgi:hypothetical protein